jgi:hypothetical protein
MDESPSVSAYEDLFRYFVEGFEAYRTPAGARARYPGSPSFRGPKEDSIEGFTRMSPLFAAWLSSGRMRRIPLRSGTEVDLVETLRRGVVAGTNPASPDYWGEIKDWDQRIVEAADVALCVWLLPTELWAELEPHDRKNLVRWLSGVNGKQTADNNWHLFVVFVNAVLRGLNQPFDAPEMKRRYDRFKSFYRGEGWFSDGPESRFDYYNSWGIHYLLYWLQRVDPEWDRDFLTGARKEFISKFKYLFTPRGFPILGRSVCYRMAAPTALLLGHASDPNSVTAGEARRALDVTWRYFVSMGGVRDGRVTQGYCDDDVDTLDEYLSPGSCLWSLRSLVAALTFPKQSEFWSSPGDPLPVERESFRFAIEATGWRVVGDRDTGTVSVEILANEQSSRRVVVQNQRLYERYLELTFCRASRPPNDGAKYGLAVYSSARPFCGCTAR